MTSGGQNYAPYNYIDAFTLPEVYCDSRVRLRNNSLRNTTCRLLLVIPLVKNQDSNISRRRHGISSDFHPNSIINNLAGFILFVLKVYKGRAKIRKIF